MATVDKFVHCWLSAYDKLYCTFVVQIPNVSFTLFTGGGPSNLVAVNDESLDHRDPKLSNVEMDCNDEEEVEEEDTHRCAKCHLEFTSLQDYVHHKMTSHKLKVCFRQK